MPDDADTVAWIPINDYPGDQQYDDVPSNDPEVSYWATIGPQDAGRWSWTINATNDACDQWEEDGGVVATEAEAKAAVEGWAPRMPDSVEGVAPIMPHWPPTLGRHLITVQVRVDSDAAVAENVACRAADYILESFEEAENASIQTVLVHSGPFTSTEDGIVHGAQQYGGEDAG